MKQRFIFNLSLSRNEVEKVRERFRQNLEMNEKDFKEISTEEAIEDLFYFDDGKLDLRYNLKVKRREKKNVKLRSNSKK